MIRRLNKIISLVAVSTIIGSALPAELLNNNVSAAVAYEELQLDNESNIVALASTQEEAALEVVLKAMLPTKAGYAGSVVSDFSKCGTISYELDNTAAQGIAQNLVGNMSEIVNGVKSVQQKGEELITMGTSTSNSSLVQKGTGLKESAEGVLGKLQQMQSLSNEQLIQVVQQEAQSITVYKYKALKSSDGLSVSSPATVTTEGFAVGGILGLALSPSDIYNAPVRNADYSSSSDLIPVLELSPKNGGDTYKKSLDITSSNVKVVCDGMHINVLDNSGRKLYVINNPVYNMFKGSQGGTVATDKDLNIITFPSSVTNLKASTTAINLSSKGISTSILNISLESKKSATAKKIYKYVLPVDNFEVALLNSAIGNMNISSSIKDIITDVVTPGTCIMVPDIKNNIGGAITDKIDDITGIIGDLADAIEDLKDDLKDKNDDVNDAWDKVFDRFDNDEGWGTRDGYTYYYDKDGISLKGVQNIGGKIYYFNRIDGAMQTGWQIVDGKKCYFDKNKGYQVFNQWIQDGEEWYYVGKEGSVVKSEWINSLGTWYYMKADGKMAKGWLKVDDSWYLFNNDGSMVSSSWKWEDGSWYYLKDNGAAATNWNLIDGKWYCFKDPSGSMQTGWFRNDGKWYCTDSNGVMMTGWVNSSDGWCYLDDSTGQMKKNEWVRSNGNWYYFNVNGIMVTGKRYINGTKYVFNSNGTLQ